MKKVLFLLFLLISVLQSTAQPKIETSAIFEESLSQGWTKLMRLKNGNTFYLHYGGKKGMEVTVFDKNRKKTANRNIKSALWNVKKKKRVKICGIYEINGKPVIFIEYATGVAVSLYRMQLNPENGSLIKEDEIKLPAQKKYMWGGAALDVYFGEKIHVVKDPEADNYMVIFLGLQERNLDDRICVMHFDGDHKIINMAYYKNPEKDFKTLNYIGAVVDGNKRVYIATYGAHNQKGKNAHVYIARLNALDSIFLNKTLDFTDDFMKTNSQMVYDRKNSRLVMLTNTVASEKRSTTTYASFLSFIDPEDLSLKGVKIINNEKVNAYARNTNDVDLKFHGLPQKFVINPDNSITICQEQLTFADVVRTQNGIPVGTVAEYTYLGNIGITEIDADGGEKAGYAMMKKQLYVGKLGALYMASRDNGRWTNNRFSKKFTDDNLFMSYQYIHTNNGNYVLFNDVPKNDKKEEDQIKRKLANNTDYINTICYTIKDGVAKRSYLFGEPTGKNETKACYIDAADYDKNSKIYTTVLSEQHGRKYDSRIAWIYFE
jgi:hypothetical protein